MNCPFKNNKANVLFEDLESAANIAEDLNLISLALSIKLLMLGMIDQENCGAIIIEQCEQLKKINNKYAKEKL